MKASMFVGTSVDGFTGHNGDFDFQPEGGEEPPGLMGPFWLHLSAVDL